MYLALAFLAPACERSEEEHSSERAALDADPSRTSGERSAQAGTAIADATAADVAAVVQQTSLPVDPTAEEPSPCPEHMVWVRGDYCPAVAQRCLEYHPEYLARRGDPTVSERCLRYAEPSRCLSERRPASFCMDRYEYPNLVGELPRVLTSWLEARQLCEAQGKRLCTEDEFNFACEGPDMLPYATGFERDASACNMDRPYRQPNHGRRMKTHEDCPSDEWCAAEMERLDQRHRIGDKSTCVSWAGLIDLNGNVNEWVMRPEQKAPERSGLKGGWWGPVRNRCRPTVGFHKENDYGYEAGFRCCSDALRDDEVSP